MISNPAPDPKKSHNSAGSDSKNPDPEQHCKKVKTLRELSDFIFKSITEFSLLRLRIYANTFVR